MAVHAFPLANPRVQQVGPFYIAERLGMRDATIKTLVQRIRQLIEGHGFPPPLGYRQWRGELVSGAAAVCMRSYWIKEAVDAFFDGTGTTPPIAAALQSAELAAHGSELDRRAGMVA